MILVAARCTGVWYALGGSQFDAEVGPFHMPISEAGHAVLQVRTERSMGWGKGSARWRLAGQRHAQAGIPKAVGVPKREEETEVVSHSLSVQVHDFADNYLLRIDGW
jgi:hypothetical protein